MPPRRQISTLASRRTYNRLTILKTEITNLTESILVAQETRAKVEAEVKILCVEAERQLELAYSYSKQTDTGTVEGNKSLNQVVAHLLTVANDMRESNKRKLERVRMEDDNLVEMLVQRATRETEVFLLKGRREQVMILKLGAGTERAGLDCGQQDKLLKGRSCIA